MSIFAFRFPQKEANDWKNCLLWIAIVRGTNKLWKCLELLGGAEINPQALTTKGKWHPGVRG